MKGTIGREYFNKLTCEYVRPIEIEGEAISLRDWFAGQAMAALIACGRVVRYEGESRINAAAYKIADDMLAERSRG